LAIEPLAIAFRTDDGVSGVSRHGEIHKVSLYADDLLVYLSNPIQSLTVLTDVLESYGKISGYKLNFFKSTLFLINLLATVIDFNSFSFKQAEEFSYLGVKITRTYKDLYQRNFKTLLEQTKWYLAQWSLLPISLAGRVNSVEMKILSRFLYFFLLEYFK